MFMVRLFVPMPESKRKQAYFNFYLCAYVCIYNVCMCVCVCNVDKFEIKLAVAV